MTPAEAHLPLVYSVLQSITDRGGVGRVERDDMFQAGAIGLLQAVDRFRPERGNAFSTFAVPRIAGEIREEIRRRGDRTRSGAKKAGRGVGVEARRDSNVPGPDADMIAQDDAAQLRRLVNELPTVERFVVGMIYHRGKLLREIADKLAVTESRVSQIHTAALRRLRFWLAED